MRFAHFALAALVALTLGACAAREASTGLSIPHPDDASKQIEYFVEKPEGQGPWPTVVFLHGHQEGARPGGKDFVDWGVLANFAERGYLAVAVSQPGYGHSSGPADFSGPFTQHAVSAVIAKVRAEGHASPNKLLIQGISRGAISAGLVAAADPSIYGLVLISGAYDLPAYVADAQASDVKAEVAKALISETGGSEDALRARSLLHVAGRIKAQTLILNGAQDDRTNADEAQKLAEHMRRNGVAATAIIYPEYGHRIPVEVRNRDVDPFIDRVLFDRSLDEQLRPLD